MNTLYPVVAERAVYRCEYRHAPETVFNFPFEVEHVLPQARGGSDDLDNLALTCHACNLFKSDFETGQDEASHAEVALFHPRRDSHMSCSRPSRAVASRRPVHRARRVCWRVPVHPPGSRWAAPGRCTPERAVAK